MWRPCRSSGQEISRSQTKTVRRADRPRRPHRSTPLLTIQIGILLALTCAFVSNLGFFFKHRGACEVAKVDIRRPFRTARNLYSSKWFAIGMGIACSAWIFHVAALAVAPISVVQVVLAGGVVMIGVMAQRLFGVQVGRRQWCGLALTCLGLILLAATFPHSSDGAHSSFNTPAMIAFEAGLFGIGGLLIMGPRVGAPAEHHGVMLGAASGVLFGVSDVAIKALTGIAGDGIIGVVTSPWLAVTIAASVGAFFSSARGLQDGDAVSVIAITGTAANITTVAAGIIVFGDPLPGTTVGIVLQAFAFVLVIVASALTPSPGGHGAPSRGAVAAGAAA
jgi:multidrug transporter EmrE-like cation transporter